VAGGGTEGQAEEEEEAVSALLDDIDVIRRLENAIALAGSQRAFATAHGLHEGSLSEVLYSKRKPTAQVLNALGLREVRRFTESRKSNA